MSLQPRELELPERDPVKAEVKDTLKQIIEAVVMRHFVEEQVSPRFHALLCHSLSAPRMCPCSLHVCAAGDATGGAGGLSAAVLDARRGAAPRAAAEARQLQRSTAWQLQRSAATAVCSGTAASGGATQPTLHSAPGRAAPQPRQRRHASASKRQAQPWAPSGTSQCTCAWHQLGRLWPRLPLTSLGHLSLCVQRRPGDASARHAGHDDARPPGPPGPHPRHTPGPL